MQPDNNQTSSSYLDSIAVQPQAKKVSPLMLWALIGGVLLIVIVFMMLVLSSGRSSAGSLVRFGTELASLKTVASEAQPNIQSGELRTLNSSLTLVITNANRDVQAPLTELAIKLDDDKNKEIIAVGTETTALTERLEDARLNAIYDRTYAREIAFYIKSLRNQMTIIYNSTKSKSLKDVIETTDANLDPLQKSFSSFNAA